MRTIQQIYDEIIKEKEQMSELSTLQPGVDSSQTLLNDLTSTSKVAVWRLWAWVMAVVIWTHEKLWVVFRTEVDAIVAAAIPGTARWYREMCLQFQYGDAMMYQNFKFIYNPINPDNRIIARASATEVGGNVLLKVAKLENNTTQKLTTDELEAFTSYISKIKFAGTYCQIISAEADLLRVSLKVIYDPIVMNGNGELLSNTSIKPVEQAISNYLAALPWDGKLLLSALVDAVQNTSGVVDVVINNAFAKAYAAATWNTISRYYYTVSGWIINDNNYPLINYQSV